MKNYIDKNVYQAARERIAFCIDHFDDYYVSFSGGKDSGALLELVVEVAREKNRLPVKAVFSDLEVIFDETVQYVKRMFERPEIKGYWFCLSEIDDNGSSIFERYFRMWDKDKKEKWIHEPPEYAITDENCPENMKKYLNPDNLDFWYVRKVGEFFCDEFNLKNVCNFIGMRGQESYGRYMCVKTEKHRTKVNNYTYKTKDAGERTFISLPLYDWNYQDIWRYYAIKNLDYNRTYDRMFKLGLSYPMMRTCSAFGEEQKKTLYYWKIFEPETFEKMLKRVEGVNFGALYNHTNINRGAIKKPQGITWKEYLNILLSELPEMVRENYKEKFDIAFRYHYVMYEVKENIPKEIYIQDSRKDAKRVAKEKGMNIKYFISYQTLCEAIIKRDFVFKKYGFGYSKKMQERITEMEEWKEKL